MDVSIIIINYNTDKHTIKAVESVLKYSDNFNYEIIVVDNNSDSTNLKEKLSSYKNIHFYQLDNNIGFGNANNIGFSKSKGNYIFLLNSDAYLINENTIPIFMNYLKSHKDVGCVGGNLVNEKDEPNISYGAFLSVERILYDYSLKKVNQNYFTERLATSKHCDFNKPTPVDYLSGAALMIKRDLIEKYGFFDSRYFMYFEDMELCYRFKKKGYLSVILPHIKIVHIGGQSRVNNKQLTNKVANEVAYSKYLFLQNITSKHFAFMLFVIGKFLTFYNRIKRKLKKVIIRQTK